MAATKYVFEVALGNYLGTLLEIQHMLEPDTGPLSVRMLQERIADAIRMARVMPVGESEQPPLHKCLFCGTPQDVKFGAKFVKARDCGCVESRYHIDNCDSLGCELADGEPGDCSYQRLNRLYEKAHGAELVPTYGLVPHGLPAGEAWQTARIKSLDKILDCTCPTPILMTSGCQCGAMKKGA